MTEVPQNHDGDATVARPGPPRESRRGWRAAGTAGAAVAAPIIARGGGGVLARCKTEWPAIAGSAWAEQSWPVALGRDGVLKLHVVGAAALELQHRAPLLIERINLFFGRAAVARLTLVQGPLPLPPPQRRPPPEPLTAARAAALDARLGAVIDPALRQALHRLGTHIAGESLPARAAAKSGSDAAPGSAPKKV